MYPSLESGRAVMIAEIVKRDFQRLGSLGRLSLETQPP